MREPSPVPGPAGDAPRIIFLHIAKTAGSSVVEYFRRRLPEGAVFSHGDFMRHPQDRAFPAEVVAQYRMLSGHFGFVHVEPWLADAYSFTFLRDPVERVLSFYKFCLHEDMQRQFAVARAAARLGLEGFLVSDLPEVAEMLDDQQTWQLARMYWQSDRKALAGCPGDELLGMACEHLQRLSRVGLTGTFPVDFRRIVADLGMPSPKGVPRVFQTPDPVVEAGLPGQVRARLKERNALDARLVEFAREHLCGRGD